MASKKLKPSKNAHKPGKPGKAFERRVKAAVAKVKKAPAKKRAPPKGKAPPIKKTKRKEGESSGQPTKYKPEYADQALKVCARLGATDGDLADLFNVSVRTICNWKMAFPEFAAATDLGKDEADARVEQRLFQRAIGYEHDEVHITTFQGEVTLTPIRKVYAPDTEAAKFWLTNRQGKAWKNKQSISGDNDGDPINVVQAMLKDINGSGTGPGPG